MGRRPGARWSAANSRIVQLGHDRHTRRVPASGHARADDWAYRGAGSAPHDRVRIARTPPRQGPGPGLRPGPGPCRGRKQRRQSSEESIADWYTKPPLQRPSSPVLQFRLVHPFGATGTNPGRDRHAAVIAGDGPCCADTVTPPPSLTPAAAAGRTLAVHLSY
jgi:hypothetical protein